MSIGIPLSGTFKSITWGNPNDSYTHELSKEKLHNGKEMWVLSQQLKDTYRNGQFICGAVRPKFLSETEAKDKMFKVITQSKANDNAKINYYA